MSDNQNDKLNMENADAEAAKRAERIRAIREAIRAEGSEEVKIEAPAAQPAEANASSGFEDKFRRVRERRLAGQENAEAPGQTAAEEPMDIAKVIALEAAEKNAAAAEADAAAAEMAAEGIIPEQTESVPEAVPMNAEPVIPPAEPVRNAPPQQNRPVKKNKKKKRKKPKTLGQKFRGLFPEKGDKPLEIVRKFVFLASVIAIIVCGYMVGDYYLDLWRSRMEYDSINDLYTTYTPIMTTVESDDTPKADKYYNLLPGAQKLMDLNKDVVGYITIPTIDGDPIVALPVVQSNDNKKYLDLSFKGEASRAGALFLDWRNSLDKVENHRLVQENSGNLVIYGHNMADESMFGKLKYYRRNPDYYGTHPIIQFNSNYEMYTFKIFAFFIVDANDLTSEYKFEYWNKLDFYDEDDFYDFVNEAKRRTLRTNDVDVEYGDQILTLSTCNTDIIDTDGGRLILIARAVRPGEDPYEGTQNSQPNPNIKWPALYYAVRTNEKYDFDAPFEPYGPKK